MSQMAEDAVGAALDRTLLARLLRYLRPVWYLVAAALLVLLLNSALTLVAPRMLQQAIDVAIPNGDTPLLITLTMILAGSIVLQFGMEYSGALLTTLLGQRVMHELRQEVFGKLQRLSIPYFDRHPVGRLTTRVTSDVETLNELLSSGLVTVIGDLFTLFLILVMMALMDWRLTLVACAVIPGVASPPRSSGAGCGRRSGVSGGGSRGSTATCRSTWRGCGWCSSSVARP